MLLDPSDKTQDPDDILAFEELHKIKGPRQTTTSVLTPTLPARPHSCRAAPHEKKQTKMQ